MIEPQRRKDAKVKKFNAENAEKAQRTLRKQQLFRALSGYPQMTQICADYDSFAARLSAAAGGNIRISSAQICVICG
jgi:hypothetical protein